MWRVSGVCLCCGEWPFNLCAQNPATHHGLGGTRVLQLSRPGVAGHVHITRTPRGWTIATRGVLRLQLYTLYDEGRPESVAVDGQTMSDEDVVRAFSADHSLSLVDMQWTVSQHTGLPFTRLASGYGPMRQVFANRCLVVIGTRQTTAEPALLQLAQYFSAGHDHATGAPLLIVRDVDVALSPQGVEDMSSLVLLGGPDLNIVSAHLDSLSLLPVSFDGGSFSVGGCMFSSPGYAVATMSPLHRLSSTSSLPPTVDPLALVVAGTDLPAMRTLLQFSFAMNQPLTRAPLSNMVPDFFVTSPDYEWKGYGGLSAAGYWGNSWEYRTDTAYMDCPHAMLHMDGHLDPRKQRETK
mmetsp:Transcript_72301/g.170086  ORF Transcript_72301/g.170086 Transcript_72301/m.170086 type:complete len:352 (+) Transcript_72301:36-1091(+)